MNPNDFQSGELVLLEPVVESAADDLLDALLESQPELLRFMPWDCWTVEQVNAFIDDAVYDRAHGLRYEFAIREKNHGQFLGVIGLKDFTTFSRSADVGYWIRSSMTRKGYASDALRTVLRYCKNELNLVRVDARAAASNIPSQKVLINCGFEKEGLKRKGEFAHGRWLDMVLFGKLL